MVEKLLAFAQDGKGRRMLNTLNKKDTVLTDDKLDEVLKIYRDIGLPKEVEMMKKRRGILNDNQYNALAQAVKRHCSADNFDAFAVALRDLLSCGIKMNPTKMDP